MVRSPFTRTHALLAVVAAGLAGYFNWTRGGAVKTIKVVSTSSLPVTFQTTSNELERRRLERVPFISNSSATPDTTAIILNWSRLHNVIYIASLLCGKQLDHIIQQVVIWNNNPIELSHKDFSLSKCPAHKLQIHNSPENLYFQARFLACAQADTPYCFIQDDDYIVWPEVLETLHHRVIETSSPGIHLLPPHESLSSHLRSIWVDESIHTSFAWLGHGAMMPRSRVVDFLSLLTHLNLTEEQMKMADNYYTLLGNSIVETWFDQGYELGGGQPFTVGAEGDERNDRRIHEALRILDSVFSKSSRPDLPYIEFVTTSTDRSENISRAPCFSAICLFEASIPLLPDTLNRRAAAAGMLLVQAADNEKLLGNAKLAHYISHAPSNAVDGRPETAFCSPLGRYSDSKDVSSKVPIIDRSPDSPRNIGAKSGEYVGLDMLQLTGSDWQSIYLALLVDDDTVGLIQKSIYEVSLDGKAWIATRSRPSCTSLDALSRSETGKHLWECAVQMLPTNTLTQAGARHFRVRVSDGISETGDDTPRWCIHEMWIRGIRQ